MAIVYKVEIKTRKLVEFFRVIGSARIPETATIKTFNSFDKETIDKLSKDSDLYYSDEKNYFGIHTHSGPEQRLIVSGKATFYVCYKEFVYIIDAEPLDFIELEPNTIHWFSSSGEVLAYRFFSNTERIARDVIPPEGVLGFQEYIYNYGRRFN